jgi:hypothetical protein
MKKAFDTVDVVPLLYKETAKEWVLINGIERLFDFKNWLS